MKKIDVGSLRKVFLVLCLYLMVFPNIKVPNLDLSYKFVFCVFISFILIIKGLHKPKYIQQILTKKYHILLLELIILFAISIFSNFINIKNIAFEMQPFNNLFKSILIDSVYMLFICNVLLKTKNRTEKIILIVKAYILVITIDNFIACLRYSNSYVNDFLLTISPIKNELLLYALNTKGRLLGLGGMFFLGGVNNAIVLVVIFFILEKKYYQNYREKLRLYILFCFNLIIGTLIARTTLLGILIICIYIIIFKKVFFLLKYIFFIVFFSLIFYQLFFLLSDEVQIKIQAYLTGKLLYSLQGLRESYEILPRDVLTIIIGDAKWGSISSGYYMNVDSGYQRYIFYGGILFLTNIILVNYLLIPKNNYNIKKLSINFFILYLILLIKGVVIYINISFIIWFTCLDNKNKLYNIKNKI